MKNNRRALALILFAVTLGVFQFAGSEAQAQSSYFSSRGCTSCHSAPVTATCNGCHYHGAVSLKGTTNKTSYAPGETVSVTISGGSKTGWIQASLYDQNNKQVAISSGNASGMGHSTTFPAVLSAPAPATPGTYTWKAAWHGNMNDSGSAHGDVTVNTNSFTVTAPADTTKPVVSAFTLPASATSMTVPVSSFTATDNVAVTGYMVTTSVTAPAAGAAGWTASAPSSVTATAAGSTTFYAWAKDAAGNVSAAKSVSVTITLPDTTKPVVSAFTLPATATSLTVPVSSFTATDNVAVTGYMVTTSATAPAAGAAGWTATAPTSVTAAATGSVTFYAWAKDAAGNVSASRSASVTITTTTADTTKPILNVSTLANSAYTNMATLNISGNASDAGGLQSVTVGGQTVAVNPDGSFSAALTLAVGANTVTVIATDKAGNQQTDTRTINYDPTAPVLTISAPADNSNTTQSFVTLTGTINETSKVMVTDNNGGPQTAAVSGNNFTATVYLQPGVNTITLAATDLAGNTTSAKRTVTYDISTLALAVTNPNQDITTNTSSLVLTGTVSGTSSNVTMSVTINGQTYNPPVVNGTFQQQLTFTKPKLYAITVTATDASGNSSTVNRNVIFRRVGGKNK